MIRPDRLPPMRRPLPLNRHLSRRLHHPPLRRHNVT